MDTAYFQSSEASAWPYDRIYKWCWPVNCKLLQILRQWPPPETRSLEPAAFVLLQAKRSVHSALNAPALDMTSGITIVNTMI